MVRIIPHLLLGACLILLTGRVQGERLVPFWPREERTMTVRDSALLRRATIPAVARPTTVVDMADDAEGHEVSLDDVIRIALQNSRVIRVLGGTSASSTGRTVYDVAITHQDIERQKALFDPTIDVRNSFSRNESPQAVIDPADATRTLIDGGRSDNYNLGVGVAKRTITGGTASLNLNVDRSRLQPGIFALNPQASSTFDLGFTQPLLQGGGVSVNMIPICLSRISTEQSYFQFKDSLQSMVRSVVQGYWSLVNARIDLWARQQQRDQAEFAFELAEAQRRSGRTDGGQLAQARLAFANFRASLISSKAALLDREAALRNVLGLPPEEMMRLVPVTPPSDQRLEFDWDSLLVMAEQNRPDIIELKLVMEADEQRLLLAQNNAQPRLDATGQYRWNGLEGEMPIGDIVRSTPGDFTGWTMSVNFSVPLGLRQARAELRQQELILMRDKINLDQGMHQVVHNMASSLRFLEQLYEQYEAFKETREAARLNLEQQIGQYRNGQINFINVLQAITDWGNAVSSEAQSLTQYNASLVDLEFETGTVLETHGIRMFEERFCSIGPMGRLGKGRWYPQALRPSENADRYLGTDQPSEEFFDLAPPKIRRSDRNRAGRSTPPEPPVRTPPVPTPAVSN